MFRYGGLKWDRVSPDVERGEASVAGKGVKDDGRLFLQPRLVQTQRLQLGTITGQQACEALQGGCTDTGESITLTSLPFNIPTP